MKPQSELQIRTARTSEISRLREIENAAGTMFSGLGLIDESLDAAFSQELLAQLLALGQVWVICTPDDLPVGMVLASVREAAVYIEEIDVMPAYGRRGLGGQLLEWVCRWAQTQGHAAVTLSTFREVPWNGPFYRKHGFRELAPTDWTPGMHRIREKEAQHGLQVESRCFMLRKLR